MKAHGDEAGFTRLLSIEKGNKKCLEAVTSEYSKGE